MPSGVGAPKTAPSWHVDCGVYTLELLQLRSWLHWSWFLRFQEWNHPSLIHILHILILMSQRNMNHQYYHCTLLWCKHYIYIYRNNLRYIDTTAYMISMQQATYPWSHALPMFSCQVTKALSMALRAMAAGLKGDGRSQGRWFCWSRPPASFPGGDLVIHLPSCFTRFTVTVAWLLWKRRFFFGQKWCTRTFGGFPLWFSGVFWVYGQFMHILSMARELPNGIPMDL